jgi:hypothetical protein
LANSQTPMLEPKSASRRPWLVFVPFAVVVVLAIVWSAFWYFAAHRSEAVIAAWIEQEARAGRVYTCGSRTVGGYPFRIEVRCTDPTMELSGLEPPRIVKAKELVALAQVYEPNLIIAEITGPLSSAAAGNSASVQAEWRLAQASLRAAGRRPERLSIVFDGVKLQQTEGAIAETIGTANRLELHIRRSPTEGGEILPIDFAAQIGGAVLSSGPLGGRPIDAETSGILRGMADFKRQPMSARLKDWQMAGGRLELTRLKVQQGDAIAIATGDIGLSASGRPDGAFNVTMTGFDQVVRDFVRGSGMQLGVIAGLSLLGRPADIEGRRGVSLPLRFRDGAASLGPIPLGKLEPLF